MAMVSRLNFDNFVKNLVVCHFVSCNIVQCIMTLSHYGIVRVVAFYYALQTVNMTQEFE